MAPVRLFRIAQRLFGNVDGTVRFCRPLARRSPPPAAITCACTDRWLRCPGWRIWSRRSRRSHTLTKPRLHRPHSERCPYRSRDARAVRARDLPWRARRPGRTWRSGRRTLCACWAGGPLWTRPGLAAAPDCQQRMEKQFKSCRIGRPPAMCNSLQPPIEHRQETKSCNVRFGSNADILGCQRDVCLLPKADILPRYHPLVLSDGALHLLVFSDGSVLGN